MTTSSSINIPGSDSLGGSTFLEILQSEVIDYLKKKDSSTFH